MTNCIFFSENLCKVGSFVLTLVLCSAFVPFTDQTIFYSSGLFLKVWRSFTGKKRHGSYEVWRSFTGKKKHGSYASPCSVNKVHDWIYVLVQDI